MESVDDPWKIYQREDESLQSLVTRFKMAILSTEVSDGFRITLLKLALKPDSPLYLDMILDHPKTLAYDLHRAEVHTQME